MTKREHQARARELAEAIAKAIKMHGGYLKLVNGKSVFETATKIVAKQDAAKRAKAQKR